MDNGGLRGGRQSALGTFALSSQESDGPLVAAHVLAAVLLLEVLHATTRLPKSSPPKWVSPAVAFTSKIPSCSSKYKILRAMSVQCLGVAIKGHTREARKETDQKNCSTPRPVTGMMACQNKPTGKLEKSTKARRKRTMGPQDSKRRTKLRRRPTSVGMAKENRAQTAL